ERIGVSITTISHAKFRMKNYKISRDVPIICDEFHMLGGHGAVGWKKLDSAARSLRAPIALLSATPNYNDAERVYCVKHILEPDTTRGGYLSFLYEHCKVRKDPFSAIPI